MSAELPGGGENVKIKIGVISFLLSLPKPYVSASVRLNSQDEHPKVLGRCSLWFILLVITNKNAGCLCSFITIPNICT